MNYGHGMLKILRPILAYFNNRCDKCLRKRKYRVNYTLRNNDSAVGKIFYPKNNLVSRECGLCFKHKEELLNTYKWPVLVGFRVEKL